MKKGPFEVGNQVLISDKVSANLGQPVIVDNRAGGAGGTVGAKSVVTAEPDGHTILLCSTSNLLIAPLIYKDVGYNAGTFVPVARIGGGAGQPGEIAAWAC